MNTVRSPLSTPTQCFCPSSWQHLRIKMGRAKESLLRHLWFTVIQGSIQNWLTKPIHLKSLKGKKEKYILLRRAKHVQPLIERSTCLLSALLSPYLSSFRSLTSCLSKCNQKLSSYTISDRKKSQVRLCNQCSFLH